jgi:hypothetical protein
MWVKVNICRVSVEILLESRLEAFELCNTLGRVALAMQSFCNRYDKRVLIEKRVLCCSQNRDRACASEYARKTRPGGIETAAPYLLRLL